MVVWALKYGLTGKFDLRPHQLPIPFREHLPDFTHRAPFAQAPVVGLGRCAAASQGAAEGPQGARAGSQHQEAQVETVRASFVHPEATRGA